MEIQKIRLENWRGFRGISEFSLSNVRSISGKNGLGKTTIADAVSYVLCGCNAMGVADFEIRPVKGKVPMRGGVYAVTLTIMHNEEITTLTRGVRDVESRKRGTTEITYKSEGIREVDGVPVSVADYEGFIARICLGQSAKGLTFADWIFGLPIAQRRAYLMSLVAPEERAAIEANASAESGNICSEFKEGETPQQFRKRVVAKVSEMKKLRDSNNAKIEENFAQITNVASPAEEEIKALKEELSLVKTEKASDEVNKLLAKINKISKEQATYLAKVAKEQNAAKQALIQEKNRYSYEITDLAYANKKIEGEMGDHNAGIVIITHKFEEAKIAYTEARNALAEVPEIPLICPCCGQTIPDYLRQEWQEKEIAKATSDKKAKLQLIINKATEYKEKIEALNVKIAECGISLKKNVEKMDNLQRNCDEIDSKINNLDAELEMVNATDYMVERQDQIEAMQKRITEIESGNGEDEEAKKAKIASLQEQITEAETLKAKADEDRKRQSRILELQEANAQLADEIADAERKRDRAELYERLLADGVTAGVNAKFPDGLEWVFSEPQVNGGIADVAELYVDGVNINDINHAKQVTGKLAVTVALQDAHGVNIPIFVDNAESVNDFPEYEGRQIIALIVTKDAQLTFNP